ncbi:MAG: hypothetical protein A2Y17_13390 [Clostridiales bacterium GWF2_38_85]|nr:MAG: hypothetical protein A2Y17_13390 [Clostridiales bacterium GWF2_38_85]
MAAKLKYSSGIKDFPLLYLEMKKTAQLLLEGKTDAEILSLSTVQNIFQLDKEKRRKSMPYKTLTRLHELSVELIAVIAHGSDENARLISFYGLVKTDILLFEFMRDVFHDKYLSGQTIIADSDFIVFLNCKANESEYIAGWKPEMLRQIKNTYKKVLCEAGLAKRQGEEILVIKPLMNNELKGMFARGDVFAETMLLEVGQ